MNITKEQSVYPAIKDGLMGLKYLSKIKLIKYWDTMTKEERWKAGRILVYMEQVANNPALYFSRAATQNAWAERIKAIEQTADVKSDGRDNLAQDPKDIVFYNVFPLLASQKLKVQYYNFCSSILDWEYGRTMNDEIGIIYEMQGARKILRESKKIKQEVNTFKFHNLVRNLKKKCKQFHR